MWPSGTSVRIGRPVFNVASASGSTNVSVVEHAPVLAAPRAEAVRIKSEAAAPKPAPAPDTANALAALERAAKSFAQGSRKQQESNTRAVVLLSVEIAAKILQRELSKPEAVREMLLNTLRLAPQDARATVRLNPADCELIGGKSAIASADLVPDAAVERGGCIVQTPAETWDGQLRTRLDAIARELLGGE